MRAYEILSYMEEAELLSALNKVKKYCEGKTSCYECPFRDDGECYLRQTDPHRYDIDELAEKLTGGI